MNFYEFLREPLALSARTIFCENFSVVFIKDKELQSNAAHIHLTGIVIAYHGN
jgi:hypothetical protein